MHIYQMVRKVQQRGRKLNGLYFRQGGQGRLLRRPAVLTRGLNAARELLSQIPRKKPGSQGNPKYRTPKAKR